MHSLMNLTVFIVNLSTLYTRNELASFAHSFTPA